VSDVTVDTARGLEGAFCGVGGLWITWVSVCSFCFWDLLVCYLSTCNKTALYIHTIKLRADIAVRSVACFEVSLIPDSKRLPGRGGQVHLLRYNCFTSYRWVSSDGGFTDTYPSPVPDVNFG
jgi:hypothetical protein